jgi:hypothetical protein
MLDPQVWSVLFSSLLCHRVRCTISSPWTGEDVVGVERDAASPTSILPHRGYEQCGSGVAQRERGYEANPGTAMHIFDGYHKA